MTTAKRDDLRKEIEQIVNHIATGIDSDSTPKEMGLLIPSLDLQKEIDKLTGLFKSELSKILTELEAEAKEFRTDDWKGTSVILDNEVKAVPLELIRKKREGI